MFRFTHKLARTLLAFALITSCAGHASAQEWVKAMFSSTSHDFGNVPRGAQSECRFVLENKYEEEVHIADVRSSCRCTIPTKGKGLTLKTYQKGEIVCQFNTAAFIGPRSAVVTVVVDKPYYGEIQLLVKGNIRSDIVTEPGQIQFGDVEKGEEKQTSVKVSYAGSKAWQIKDVQSENQNLAVKLNRIESIPGKVAYEMQVRLKPTAPSGAFNDEIVLVTNDPQFNKVTVPVRGNIVPPVTMPASIELGTITGADAVRQRMVIKGKAPFEIKAIECKDPRFDFTTPEGLKPAHLIPFEFNPGAGEAGAFRVKIKVITSIADDGEATTIVSGNVNK
ncbi:MAG: DUF1573 domain-containing protein [Planctomycetota bacterium]